MQAINIIDVKNHRDELKDFIQTRKNDLCLILDYATNYKKADKLRVKLMNFRDNPLRFSHHLQHEHMLSSYEGLRLIRQSQ
jgi:hypothetical protein